MIRVQNKLSMSDSITSQLVDYYYPGFVMVLLQ